MIEISLADSITRVVPEEWDELATGHVTASHGWLRLMEETALEQQPCRLVLAREDSRLQAAIFFWEHRTTESRHAMDYMLFGSLARLAAILGLTIHPSFVAREVSGHRQVVLFRGGLSGEDRRRLMSRMLDVFEEYALLKDRTICFTGIPQDDAEMAAVFASRGYLRSPELPVCCLDIRWQSFAEYLRWLRKRHPRTEKNIRRELSRARRSGITIQRMDDPVSDSGRLHALADAHYRRLNGRPFPFQPLFFEKLKERMGNRAVVSTAVKDGHSIGVQVRISADGHATVPIIGIDTEHARKDALYFNLGYNSTIEAAIEEGLRQMRLGRLVYDTKIRRGCRLSLSNLYIRPGNAFRRALMRPLMMARTWRMHRMLRSIIEQASSGTECPDDDGSRRP